MTKNIFIIVFCISLFSSTAAYSAQTDYQTTSSLKVWRDGSTWTTVNWVDHCPGEYYNANHWNELGFPTYDIDKIQMLMIGWYMGSPTQPILSENWWFWDPSSSGSWNTNCDTEGAIVPSMQWLSYCIEDGSLSNEDYYQATDCSINTPDWWAQVQYDIGIYSRAEVWYINQAHDVCCN